MQAVDELSLTNDSSPPGLLTIMVRVYGAVPPVQTISIDPHSVKAEVSTLKLKAYTEDSMARAREDRRSIIAVVESRP
jgi:hypothetical protein